MTILVGKKKTCFMWGFGRLQVFLKYFNVDV
jgi:hypothetical protein